MTIGTLLLPRRFDLAPASPARRLSCYARRGLTMVLIATGYLVGGIAGGAVMLLVVLLEEVWRTRASLRRAQAELAHAARVTAMGELTASIAHEVNQPLTVIVVNARACLRRMSAGSMETTELREVLQDIVDAARRAHDVSQRIRGFVRKSPVQLVPLDLNTIVQDVLTLVRDELRRHQISWRTDLAHDLPSVQGDRIQLQQVLLNLIMNAVGALREVDADAREMIIHSRRAGGGSVVVGVRDSGPGLSPGDAERIFDPFYTTKPGGMGMGLSVSRSIVEAQGGRLWAIPLGSGGVTFQISLPAA
jgi:C4-dicarboxylate-specific signal transduction histidine kinase